MQKSQLKNLSFYKGLLENNGEVYLVGGCVRDEILGKDIKDIDLIVRQIELEELIKILKKHGRTNLVGKSFGIIKFRPKECPQVELDVALPRSEISTGVAHRDFKITYDPHMPLEEDLKRRDFTINAMAENLSTDELIDPFHGKQDLENKLIRTVFPTSFEEDPLRMLRAIQFAARFGFQIEEKTFEEIKKHAKKINTIAKERIVTELQKLFTAPKPSVGFDLMRETGLLKLIFPDVQKMIGVTQPKKNYEDVYTHTMKVLDAARGAEELEKPGDINIMFAALFHDAGKPKTRREDQDDPSKVTFWNHQHVSTGIAWRWMKENRLSTIGADPRHICHLVKHHMFETKEFHNEKALRRFIRKVGKDNVFDLLDLRLADKKGGRFPKKVYGILKLREKIRDEINRKPPFTAKDLAIKGQDLMELGFKPGPVFGEIQRFLMEKVIDEPELNQKETLVQIIEENRNQFQ